MSEDEKTKYLWAVVALVLLVMLVGLRCSEASADDQARAHAIQTADAWLRYADHVRAVACQPNRDEGTTCLVVRSSGLAVTLRCDSGRTWECAPLDEVRP